MNLRFRRIMFKLGFAYTEYKQYFIYFGEIINGYYYIYVGIANFSKVFALPRFIHPSYRAEKSIEAYKRIKEKNRMHIMHTMQFQNA